MSHSFKLVKKDDTKKVKLGYSEKYYSNNKKYSNIHWCSTFVSTSNIIKDKK